MKKKSASPLHRSIRDFGRNRLAMFSFMVVVVIAGLTVGAPLICSISPTLLRPWIGAQPPGFTHPDCLTINRFRVGASCETSTAARDCQVVSYLVKDEIKKTIRVALRRGVINRITVLDNAENLSEFNLAEHSGRCREVLADGTLGRVLPGARLVAGESAPAGIFEPGQRVLLLRLETPSPPVGYEIELESGIVQTIERNGMPLSEAVIPGETVIELTGDGRLLTLTHLLGTDELGRDLFSRILYGGRISLLIGLAATAVSLIIGVCYGAAAGYAGGRVDRLMMAAVDILYAVPFMFLVIILLVFFGRNIVILFIALGAVQWLTMARIVRGQILTLKEMEFVEAARVCGAHTFTIVARHMIPNTIGPIVVYATLMVPAVILEESFLAFIGLTVQHHGENLDSWGALVHQGMVALGSGGERSWLLLWPALTMFLTLFGLNCIGDGLRDCLDPKTRKIG